MENHRTDEPLFLITHTELKEHYLSKHQYHVGRAEKIRAAKQTWEQLSNDDTVEGSNKRLEFLEKLTGRTRLEFVSSGEDETLTRFLDVMAVYEDREAYTQKYLADHLHEGNVVLSMSGLAQLGLHRFPVVEDNTPLLQHFGLEKMAESPAGIDAAVIPGRRKRF